MSLQGSLDTFALPDVLVLLAGTAKTGELRVTGSQSAATGVDDVTACVWFQEGRLAGHDHAASPTITDAVLALLRMRRGSFDFTPGPVSCATESYEVGAVLDEAQARLAEWREIEDVVPSAASWLRLAERPTGRRITLTVDQWRLVVAIGSGRSVSGAIADLGGSELSDFRAVKDLVVDGLVTVEADAEPGTAEEGAPASVSTEAVTQPVGPQLEWATPVSSWGASSLETPPPPWIEPAGDEAYGALRVVPDISGEPKELERSGLPDWRAEMADIHDLDSLVSRPPVASPLPAPDEGVGLADGEALVVPLAGSSEESSGANEEDEPLNRGLLLKFLSSVRN